MEELPTPYSYAQFRVGELFEVNSNKPVTKKEIGEEGVIPVYSSSIDNRGVIGYTTSKPLFEVDEDRPFYVIFGDHTRLLTTVDECFSAMNTVKVLTPKTYNLRVTYYILTLMGKAIPDLGYSRHWTVAKDIKIELPITSNGDIDYDYMEQYIFNQAYEHLKNVDEYVTHELDLMQQIIGVEHFNANGIIHGLTPATNYKEYTLSGLFKPTQVTRGNRLVQSERVLGETALITAGKENWGVSGYIKQNGLNKLYDGVNITIDMFGNVFCRDYEFMCDDNIIVLEVPYGLNVAQYLTTVISKFTNNRYSYSKQYRLKDLDITTIELPVTPTGQLDLTYMEEVVMRGGGCSILQTVKHYIDVVLC